MDNLADRNTHRIHGAAIYGNMDPINIPPMGSQWIAYIPAPWILWNMTLSDLYGTVNFDAKSLKAVHRTYHTDPYTCFHRYTGYALAFATLVGSNILFRCWDWRIRFVFSDREDAKCITCIVFQV